VLTCSKEVLMQQIGPSLPVMIACLAFFFMARGKFDRLFREWRCEVKLKRLSLKMRSFPLTVGLTSAFNQAKTVFVPDLSRSTSLHVP